MGKFIPKSAKPVQAFQWKSNSGDCVYELISFLGDLGIHFELVTWQGSQDVRLLIGFDVDDQVSVDEKNWVVFEGDKIVEIFPKSTDFWAKYEVMP